MFATIGRGLHAIALAAVVMQLVASAPQSASAQSPPSPAYPQAQRDNTGDWYHGDFVADPYRWLEQHGSSRTTTWLTAQKDLARKQLDALPRRAEIKSIARETLDYARQSVPVNIAGKFYFAKNSGLDDQAIIYRANSLYEQAPEAVLNLNKVYPDAIRTLRTWSVSPDGRYLAYSVSLHGADKAEWRIRDLQTLSDYSEVLATAFDYPAWHATIAGFYYTWNGSIYFHQVGTSWSSDNHIHSDSGRYGEARMTGSGRYLVITTTRGTDPRCRVFLRDVQAQVKTNQLLIGTADAAYDLICEANGSLFFRTTSNAPKARIVAMSLQQPGTFTEVVAEAADALDRVYYAGGLLFARYIREGHCVVKMFDTSGKDVGKLDLPGQGTVGHVTSDGTADGALYSYSDYVTPQKIFRSTKGVSKVYSSSTVVYKLDDFVQEVRTYTSKDGTKIPITLAYNKSMVKDGKNLVLLYGYGGFHINLTPHFRHENMAWLRLGGVLAVPNLRGGGEGGEDWHAAGVKLKKQNVFDDYLSAARWLIDEKYTSAGKIVASGASNGGLLVGAAITQQPDLFGVALPDVGVLDMVRYYALGGTGWVSDYGDVNDKAEFDVLRSYSPLHRVKKGTHYPAVLVTAPDHDDRVNQAHSWKFTAALQWAQAADRPVLLLVTKDAGHVAGYTPTKRIEFYADTFAFCFDNIR